MFCQILPVKYTFRRQFNLLESHLQMKIQSNNELWNYKYNFLKIPINFTNRKVQTEKLINKN